ncbi:MAG: MCP four helix bundle domain-containing protein [Chromatiaceae bacterium]|nr:MCP four helix bundle domain-containing protein [Chromatiaceae bacterium]
MAGFLIVAFILLAIGLMGIRGERALRADVVKIGQVRLPAIIELNRLNFQRTQIHAQSLAARTFELWSEENQTQLVQLQRQREASWREVDEAVARYEALPKTEVEEQVYAAFQVEYAAWRSIYRRLDTLMQQMAEARARDAADPQAVYRPLHAAYARACAEMIPISDRLGAMVESMVVLNNLSADESLDDALSSSNTTIAWTLGIMVVGLVVAVALGIGLTQDTLRRLGGEPAYALEVVNRVAEGDLGVPIRLRPGDSTSLLAGLARMLEAMRRLLGEVSGIGSQVASAAEQLFATSEHERDQVRRQQNETDKVAAAINEMTATVENVAHHAADAARAARETDREADAGAEVVEQTVSAIETVAHDLEAASQVIARLSEDSREIGAVLDVIRGVAEQTNLLALNAAIEAARAGEAGRGFAVVADEVRTLASRTQASTRDIQEKIERVQSGSASAVEAMEQGRARARASVVQARRAGESLLTINGSISTINDMNTQIASAAEQQSAVAEEINRNVHSISQVVEETASGANQIADASGELSRLAAQLQERLRQFQL